MRDYKYGGQNMLNKMKRVAAGLLTAVFLLNISILVLVWYFVYVLIQW